MTIPIQYLPRRQSPWANVMPSLLGNVIMGQIGHKRQMDIAKMQLDLTKQTTEMNLRKEGYRQMTPQEASAGIIQPDFTFNKKEYYRDPANIVPLKTQSGDPIENMYGVYRMGRLQEIVKGQQKDIPDPIELYEYGRQQKELEAGPGGLQGYPNFDEWLKGYRRSGQMRINMAQKGGQALATGMAEALVEQHKDAREAISGLRDIQTGRRLLQSGIITGLGANWIVTGGKLLQRLGYNAFEDPVANTEAYVANMGRQVGKIIRMFGAGTGLSDADREYANKIAGGSIQVNEKALRKILDIGERAYRNVIKDFNKRAVQAQERFGDRLPYDLVIPEPPQFTDRNRKIKQYHTEEGTGRLVIEYENGELKYAD